MPAPGFPLSRLICIAGACVLAILGLFAVAHAQDVGMSLFGSGLTLVSVGFALFLIKRGADEIWGH